MANPALASKALPGYGCVNPFPERTLIVGYTGTRRGMTRWQKKRVMELLIELNVKYAHHGMCVGGDAEFDAICASLGIKRVGWPSDLRGMTAKLNGLHFVNDPMPPLKRNRIIAGMDFLIATPYEKTEIRKSGTWATVRYSRELGTRRRVLLGRAAGDAPDPTDEPESCLRGTAALRRRE